MYICLDLLLQQITMPQLYVYLYPGHRVHRVPGFQPSRPYWVPSPARKCCPPPLWSKRGDTLAWGAGGGGPNSDYHDGTDTLILQACRHTIIPLRPRPLNADYSSSRARILKLLRGPGIDSKESIPPAYVAFLYAFGEKNEKYCKTVCSTIISITIHAVFTCIWSVGLHHRHSTRVFRFKIQVEMQYLVH